MYDAAKRSDGNVTNVNVKTTKRRYNTTAVTGASPLPTDHVASASNTAYGEARMISGAATGAKNS